MIFFHILNKLAKPKNIADVVCQCSHGGDHARPFVLLPSSNFFCSTSIIYPTTRVCFMWPTLRMTKIILECGSILRALMWREHGPGRRLARSATSEKVQQTFTMKWEAAKRSRLALKVEAGCKNMLLVRDQSHHTCTSRSLRTRLRNLGDIFGEFGVSK